MLAAGTQSLFLKAGAAGGCLAHGFLAQYEVVEHRRVSGGELAAPVLAGLEQAADTPAGQGFVTHSKLN